jgi:CBS domain-containing protein
VTPDAPKLPAIHLMRRHKIGCLLVKQGDHLVAILTEEDLVGIASEVLEREEARPGPAGDEGETA